MMKWLIIAVIFFIIEILTPGIFLFSCFSIGAIVAAIVSIWINSVLVQCAIFVISSILSIYILKPFLMRLLTPLTVKSNVDRLIGTTGVVVEKIEGKKMMGIVKVNNEYWRAVAEDDKVIEEGSEIVVVKVEGVHLVVRKK